MSRVTNEAVKRAGGISTRNDSRLPRRLARLLGRFVRGVVAVALTAIAAVSVLWWCGLQRLQAESHLADTARGPIEYATFGAGPALLIVHGSPGGYDQFLPLAERLSEHGYRAVTLSRPGYLRTPQRVGVTPEEQADAFAAFLDALGIEDVVVIGISGGGPSTLQFTLRHPEKVRGLVLVTAVTRRFLAGEPNADEVRAFGFTWDLGALLAQHVPALALRFLAVEDPAERRRLSRDPGAQRSIRYLFQSLGFNARRGGYTNDMLTIEWNDLDYPLGDIAVPTLVLHGSADTNVPLSHAEKIAQAVPGAELRVLDGAGHAFFVLQHRWQDQQILEFLAANAGVPAAAPPPAP